MGSVSVGKLIKKALGIADDAGGKLAKLADDYASRMKRAKEMGFDVDRPVYHGTSTDFDAFDPDRAIGTNFWSTTDRAAIESGDVGAQGKGKIKEMYHRIQNPAGWDEYDKFGTDELIAKGYDGLALKDADGAVTYSAFKPNQYRSVNAMFDPAKKESSDLLATLAAGTVGLGALMGTEEAEASTQAEHNANQRALQGLHRVDEQSEQERLKAEYAKHPQLDQFAQQLNQITTPSQNIDPNVAMTVGGLSNPLLTAYGMMTSESPIEGFTEYLRKMGADRSTWEQVKDSTWGALDILP